MRTEEEKREEEEEESREGGECERGHTGGLAHPKDEKKKKKNQIHLATFYQSHQQDTWWVL